MLDNWNDSFKHLLVSEGGFVNHPSDPGGMTNLGVTKKVWDQFIGHESDEAEMRSLTPEMVAPLYKKNYWDACRCDELPTGLDYLVFDFAVNAGPGRAIKTLQSAVGVTPDGGFGPRTLEAVMTHSMNELVDKFSESKLGFYKALPTFATFGKGWTNRVASVKAQAESMLA